MVVVLASVVLAGSLAGTATATTAVTDTGAGTGDGDGAHSGTTGTRTVDGSISADGEPPPSIPGNLSDEPPGSAPELSPARSLGYFRIEPDRRGPHTVDSATISFRLPPESLPEPGHVESVRLYRLSAGEWRPVPTRHVGGERFSASRDGGSVFAVGFTEPQFAIVDVTITPRTVSRGESVTVRVTVDNDDDAGATTVELGAATRAETVRTGAATFEKTLELGREETHEFTFELPLGTPGTLDVVIGEMTYGTVTVVSPSSVSGQLQATTAPGPKAGVSVTDPASPTPASSTHGPAR